MEPLATALQRTRNASPPSESTPDPHELQAIEPTEVGERELARIMRQIAELPEDAAESVKARGAVALQAIEARLALERQRDRIKAARPEGCWCFGLGGRSERYIPSLDGDPIPVLEDYCVCPEAVARQAQDTIERAHYAATKRQHRAKSLFNRADIPPRFAGCTFDTYPANRATRTAVQAIIKWSKEGPGSLLIHGPYGTGKTSLAVSCLRARVEQDETDALFLTAPGLLDRIRRTYEPRKSRDSSEATEADVLDAVLHASLLVIDDLGAERPTDWVQEKLFTVINHRHDQMLPTVFTSNLDPEGLAKHLGERIAWRIVEMSEVIKLDGPNLRDRK